MNQRELGEIVNKLIVEFFPDIVTVTFTAEMEGKLDDVELGKEEWQKVIDAFYKPFSKEVAKAEEEMEKIQIKDEPAGFDCEVCGSPMVIKLGRLVSSMLVVISQIVVILKPLSKKSGWNVQTVIRDKSSSVKPNEIVFSMAVIATQTVNLLLGTSQSAVTVQNVVIT